MVSLQDSKPHRTSIPSCLWTGPFRHWSFTVAEWGRVMAEQTAFNGATYRPFFYGRSNGWRNWPDRDRVYVRAPPSWGEFGGRSKAEYFWEADKLISRTFSYLFKCCDAVASLVFGVTRGDNWRCRLFYWKKTDDFLFFSHRRLQSDKKWWPFLAVVSSQLPPSDVVCPVFFSPQNIFHSGVTPGWCHP